MGLLRRLFGGGPEPQERDAGSLDIRVSVTPTSPESEPNWVIPPRGGLHPNAPPPGEVPPQGAPERWRFRVPDGVAVLNTKTRAAYNTVRLTGTRSNAAQALLASLPSQMNDSVLRTIREADGSITGIEVVHGDAVLGKLPDEDARRFIPVVAEFEARGWLVTTRTDVLMPQGGIVAIDSSQHRGKLMLAETGLPNRDHGDDLFADAYDASFSFPREQVFARRKTPEGRAEHEAWKARVEAQRPPTFILHAGSASDAVALVEWKPMSDRGVEGRGYNFYGPRSIWLRGDELPGPFKAAGCRIARVAGVTQYRGIARPDLGVGQQVQLRPEPTNRHDPNAIAVWTFDGTEQVGYLPRDVAAETMDYARRHQTTFGALVVWEFRRTGSSERVGVKLLIGPGNVRAETSAT